MAAPIGHLPLIAGMLFAVAFYPIFGPVPACVAKTARSAAATAIFGVAKVTLGIGGMTGNYLAGEPKNLTGTFLWTYVAIAASAVILGPLSIILTREDDDAAGREPAMPGVTRPSIEWAASPHHSVGV